MLVGSMPSEYQSVKGYQAFVRSIGNGKKLADNGLQFIYHNHHFEFMKFDGVLGMDILLNESDPEAFGFEIDTYWVQAGGANPLTGSIRLRIGCRLSIIRIWP